MALLSTNPEQRATNDGTTIPYYTPPQVSDFRFLFVTNGQKLMIKLINK